MTGRRKDGIETKKRILGVACKLFAENGFRDTTHENICRIAGVNIGAINYHFQSKENLYVESWKMAFQQSISRHPIDGGVSKEAPVKKRLRGRIASIMHRFADPENMEFEIVHKEIANPTGLLNDVIKESMEPLERDMRSIVRELLGEKASEKEVQLCEMSIIGQCFNPTVMRKRHIGRQETMGNPAWDELDTEGIIDHVVKFSLAGMAAISDSQKIAAKKN